MQVQHPFIGLDPLARRLTYVRHLYYAGSQSDRDIIQLISLYKAYEGKALFPNLRTIKPVCWPFPFSDLETALLLRSSPQIIKASAVHMALRITEILELIFDHVRPQNIIEPSRTQVLAMAARTCKLFREPALTALWRELNTLSPVAYRLDDHITSACL